MQLNDMIKMCVFDSSLWEQFTEWTSWATERTLSSFSAMIIRLKSKISAYLKIGITKFYAHLKSHTATFSIYVTWFYSDQLTPLPRTEEFPRMWGFSAKKQKSSRQTETIWSPYNYQE